MGICNSKRDYVQARPTNQHNNQLMQQPRKKPAPSPRPQKTSKTIRPNDPDSAHNMLTLCNKKLESNPEQKTDEVHCPTYIVLETPEVSEQEVAYSMLTIKDRMLQSKKQRKSKRDKKQATDCSNTLSDNMKQNESSENRVSPKRVKSPQSIRKTEESEKPLPSLFTLKTKLQSLQDISLNHRGTLY